MNRVQNRRAIGTILTTLKFMVIASALGIVALSFSQGNYQTFTKNLATSFSTDTNRVQESLAIENVVYHSSTQQFNVTFTNTGNIPVNVTKITIIPNTTPSFNETARPSGTVSASLDSTPNSLSTTSELVTVPGTIILPGQAYTTVIPYHCFCDPITVTAITSRGTIITKNVAPNIGWYDSNEKYRQRITINYNKIVGYPGPVTLDNEQDTNGTTSSNKLILSSFTVNSGTNRLLLVAVESNTGSVSSITFGAASLTNYVAKSNTVDSEIWYLKNPSSGTAAITVTMSGAASVVMNAYSYFGVDQTTPLGAVQSTSGSSNSVESLSLTTTNFNSTMVDSVAVALRNILTPNVGQINQGMYIDSSIAGGSSSEFVPLITSNSMGWSWSSSSSVKYAATAVEVRTSAFVDYPLLINATDTNLEKAQASANDIVFTACDGITELNSEIENFTVSNGKIQAWVQLPQLYWTPNTIAYMYYGHSNAPAQQTSANTWDSTYFGVWHMQQTPYPIALDNIKSWAGITTVGSPTQFTPTSGFTVNSGPYRLLLVTLQTNGSTISSISYGGSSLIRAFSPVTNTVDSEVWYLINPPAGGPTNFVVNTGGTKQVAYVMGAYSLFGVNQTIPFGASNTATGNSKTSASISLNTKYPGSWVMDSIAVNSATITNFKSGQTTEYTNNTSTGKISGGSGSQSVPIAGALVASPTSTTMSWSWTGSNNYADIAFEVKAEPVIQDSTVNANNFNFGGMSAPDQISGKIGYGLNFDGANNFLGTSPLKGQPNVNGPQTASIWFWYSATPSSTNDIFTLETTGGGNAVQIGYRTGTVSAGCTTGMSFVIWSYGGTAVVCTSLPSAGVWHNAVYTYDGTGTGQGKTNRLYIDGVLQTSNTNTVQTGTPNSFFIGTYDCQNCELLTGHLDELEYSTMVRSANWIATQYNNQVSPSTFVTIGSEESVLTPRPPG